jgi:omega-amidase
MHITCCQLNIAWQDKPRNFARVRELLGEAHLPAQSLVLLPEMFATGFSMETDLIAEAPGADSATCSFLKALALEHRCTFMAGLASRDRDGRCRNRALVFTPAGDLAASYAKFHPFTLGKESEHYAPGHDLVTFPWKEGEESLTVAPAVCYDLRFPELFRAATRKGAHLLAVIANWPIARHEHWLALLRARAIENQCFVAGCNRAGTDPLLTYLGGSIIYDPSGKVLAEAGNGESVITAEIHPPDLHLYRTKLPFLRDIRADLFP